jgi:hypothetical protein
MPFYLSLANSHLEYLLSLSSSLDSQRPVIATKTHSLYPFICRYLGMFESVKTLGL